MLDGVGIRELLIGTVLDGRTVVDIADGRTNHSIVLVECRADEVVTAWAFARRLVSVTGRYPVIVASWEPEFGAQFLGPLPSFPGIADGRLVDVLGERADFVTPSARIVAVPGGTGPDWLDQWESKVGPAGPLEDGELGWFDPSDQPLALVLLPITACWEIPAFLEFYGSEGVDGAARLMARLRSWNGRFGAEIVAHYGTMLEFAVPFPPTTCADASELAEAQVEIAECTTALPGLSVEDLAHLLVDRSTWFLHERP